MPHEWVNYKLLRAELSFIEILHHYGVELKERASNGKASVRFPPMKGSGIHPHFRPTSEGGSGNVSAVGRRGTSSSLRHGWRD
jgi:hypothetical protein